MNFGPTTGMEMWWVLFLGGALAVPGDNLKVAFQWKQLDFAFNSQSDRDAAIASKEFIPENNLPLGLEVFEDRLFITVPRWKRGVAASLNYINLSDPLDSPKLHPYPNWEAHQFRFNETPQIVSPFRIRADRCKRLWILDTGEENITEKKKANPPRILIYDLQNDNLIRQYEIPKDQNKEESFFANIAVEDHDCANSFAYLGDLGKPGLVVYSYHQKRSWRIKHNFFNIDPLAGEFNVEGVSFMWSDGLFGMALSKPDSENYSTLFFHPLSSTDEFSVSTKFLRTENSSYHEFKHLGSRGPKAQSGASFLDQKTGVLFYTLINLNAVMCWRTTNPAYTMQSQGRVYMNNVTMVFPNDIKVDYNDNLWVLSDRLAGFLANDGLHEEDVNFRILTAPVADAIKGTACDSMLVIPKTNRIELKPNSSFATKSLPLLVVLVAIITKL